MKITISLSNLIALESIAEDNSERWYVNGVWFNNQKAVASNAIILLEFPAILEDTDYNEAHASAALNGGLMVKTSTIKREIAMAKAQGKTLVEFVPLVSDVYCGEFPPYEQAFPHNTDDLASFDVDELIAVLQAIKKASKGVQKIVKVTFNAEPVRMKDRTWLLTVDGLDVKALIVPCTRK